MGFGLSNTLILQMRKEKFEGCSSDETKVTLLYMTGRDGSRTMACASRPTLFPLRRMIGAAWAGRAKVKAAQLAYHLGLDLVVK